jgi:hypothetical protein
MYLELQCTRFCSLGCPRHLFKICTSGATPEVKGDHVEAVQRPETTTDSGLSIRQWMIAALSIALFGAYFTLEDEACDV